VPGLGNARCGSLRPLGRLPSGCCRAAVHECRTCGKFFIPDRYERVAKHFHGLMSWAMYEHVTHRTAYGTVREQFEELFGLNVHAGGPPLQVAAGPVLPAVLPAAVRQDPVRAGPARGRDGGEAADGERATSGCSRPPRKPCTCTGPTARGDS
jgi:hypothetical protein